jgi:hypothetical protein
MKRNRLTRLGSFSFERVIVLALALIVLAVSPLFGQSNDTEALGKLGAGLRELVDGNRELVGKGQPGVDLKSLASSPRRITGVFRLESDAQNRVLADIHLDGSAPLPTMQNALVDMGAIVVSSDAAYRNGVISAYLPVAAAEKLAHMPGVISVQLAHRAVIYAGKVTSQGAAVLRSNLANQKGFTGEGVTVGILSDSYNISGSKDRALDDVRSGDLPDTTAIPGGEGLKFLIESHPQPSDPAPTDEGRGMAQIVHDIAPNAALCFATALNGEVDLANKIRSLRTNLACNADVMVDDVAYLDEPFFSDGILAQAVDDVAASDALPGHKVAYFSSAGNEARQGYSSDLRIISDVEARSILPAKLGINLNTIPAGIDTTGGFHNFDTNGGVNIAHDFAYSDGTALSFQWDDPFDLSPSGITTGLNLLFFDPVTGNFLGAANEDNFLTNQPLQLVQLNTGGGAGTSAEVLMVIARTGKGSHLARRIKYVAFGNVLDMAGLLTAQMPTTFGHACARGANGVAAAVYNSNPAGPLNKPLYEGFSSPGPSLIVFDRNGTRLDEPEFRKKPDIAAVDGVNTTFFPNEPNNDYEAIFDKPDGFPNFFGTSASASHAAGIAALVIQKAGGSGAIAPERVSMILKDSAPPRDTDLFYSEAVAADRESEIIVSAVGEDVKASGVSDRFFQVSFHSAKPAQALESLTIDLTGTGLVFDPASHPLQIAGSSGPVISSIAQHSGSPQVTLTFRGFTSGQSLTFGINRGFVNASGQLVQFGGNSGDEIAGAAIEAKVARAADPQNPRALTGIFLNTLERGYQIYDGFGLIDAVNALKLTPPFDNPPDE